MSVLISIRPQHVKNICEVIGELNGKPLYKKTTEVRKSRPKLETPFKCLIYCTKGKPVFEQSAFCEDISNGKVIGEFVCDRIDEFIPSEYGVKCARFEALHETSLTVKEMREYLQGKTGYGWHISQLKIYDEPKELSEFGNLCRKDCLRLGKGKSCEFLSTDGTPCNRIIPITSPPQSWCYVEELQNA